MRLRYRVSFVCSTFVTILWPYISICIMYFCERSNFSVELLSTLLSSVQHCIIVARVIMEPECILDLLSLRSINPHFDIHRHLWSQYKDNARLFCLGKIGSLYMDSGLMCQKCHISQNHESGQNCCYFCFWNCLQLSLIICDVFFFSFTCLYQFYLSILYSELYFVRYTIYS